MTRTRIPDDVLSAAHARSKARAEQAWDEADRLRAEIEAAGWKVVDRGTDFALSPLAPPDVTEGDRVRYGASQNVPSRLAEPPTGLATVVLIATDWPADVERALRVLRATSSDGVSIVIVANGPSEAQASALDVLARDEAGSADAAALEVLWTSERVGEATARNMAFARASGPVVVLLDTSAEPTGDIVTPLVHALDDPAVAIVGGWGRWSTDLRGFEDAPVGNVDAIDGLAQGFRRSDVASRGPLDERLRLSASVDTWWSLVLRDEGEGRPPRRAVRLDLPVIRHERHEPALSPDDEPARLRKRDAYRILDRFAGRLDLATRRA